MTVAGVLTSYTPKELGDADVLIENYKDVTVYTPVSIQGNQEKCAKRKRERRIHF
jgi:hypothetical protein